MKDDGTVWAWDATDPVGKPSASAAVVLVNMKTKKQVPAKVSCTDASCKTLRLDPKKQLASNTKYTVRIEGAGDTDGLAVKDLAGNELAREATKSFTTGS